MILNGKEILRFHSLRSPGVFSFPAFFRQRDEFLDLAWNGECVNPVFFSNNEQRLGKVLCKCLDREVSELGCSLQGGNILAKDTEGKLSLVVVLGESLCRKYEELRKNGVSVRLSLAVVVLYKLLGGDFEEDLDVEECQRVLKSQNNNLSGFYIYCDKDLVLQELKEPVYPLEAKVLVNVSDAPVGVTFGGKTESLETSECMAGVFHGQECYKLLPKDGKNGRVELTLRYHPDDGKVYLKVSDISGQKEAAHEIDDIASFYINKYGYAYVTKDGEVVIPESERFNMYSLQSILQYYEDKHIVAVTCADDEGMRYDIICSTD